MSMARSTSPSPSIEGHPLLDDLILDAPVSSNPSSTLGGTDTPPSPSPKIPSPKAVPGDSVLLSLEEGTTRSDAVGITAVSPIVTKDGAREKDGGGESPSEEECRPGSVRDCLFIHSSGEPSSQEVPPIVDSPKWDGTPTQPGVEILVPPEPLATAEGTSSPPNDDEVPIHLVFKRKTRPATWPTVQRSVGTSGGPTTRGTVKKSLDQILEESRQNTLKRRRVTRQTVLEEESLSSPVVDLECGTSSHSKYGSSKSEKPTYGGGGLSKKEKKLDAIGKTVEGPGAPVDVLKGSIFSPRAPKVNVQSQPQWEMMSRHGLLTLGNKRGAEIAILKASQSSAGPGALLDLQEENARLKSANASLKNQLEELTRQMICDQRATNERIDKLMAKL
ncbi:hypothetical protein HAX54_012356 [Datura stramonium]|uniref:Uncharacterized protein n=1 Tax=Datura stramonium TaxID=4076 RepID=A0ABS8Y561_DATST|nr:hypothetical protein [Datura stramonium]